jgi:diguanylate cyclase (GGDEF)-like protein
MPITISVGVAAHPDLPVETAAELIAAADEALYEAKRSGRNRVVLKHGPSAR